MTPVSLERAAKALRLLTEAHELGIDIAPYGGIDVEVDGEGLRLVWDEDAEESRGAYALEARA